MFSKKKEKRFEWNIGTMFEFSQTNTGYFTDLWTFDKLNFKLIFVYFSQEICVAQ